MLKAIKHCKSRFCCKYHLHRNKRAHEEPQQQQQCTLVTSITGVLSTFCGETALCPQCCRLGCEKTNLVYCRVCSDSTNPFLFGLCRYPCTKPQGKRNDNNHYLVDCWFPFLFSGNPHCHGLIRSREHPSRSIRSVHASLLALDFVRSRVRRLTCSLRSLSRSNMR